MCVPSSFAYCYQSVKQDLLYFQTIFIDLKLSSMLQILHEQEVVDITCYLNAQTQPKFLNNNTKYKTFKLII